MALSNVELYEALKGPVGEEAARLIAEVVPAAEDLATRGDLLATRAELKEEMAGVRLEIVGLKTEIQRSSKETFRWMLVLFIPVWAGTWGTLLATIFKH